MMMDRENEREIELERAMYTNCLLLGLDPAIIGIGGSTGIPPVGRFRHSNPKLGEQLLYFILSSLRGPIQSAEDFDQVWPILDAAQSHDFRKVVQGIISELESQGALPMINARVSSLSTYCGFRFVELLWQLSLHALLEVHSRTFAADVASNPLPAPLTDAASSHAITLLPVTKAWIALERRKFLKNAEAAVQRQRMWSNLAHEMTAEFRGLYAEEAYLQQELKKVHNFRNKVKLEGELWNDLLSSSSQNSNVVSKANRLWESLLAHKGQYEVLASDPIKDLIAHREHMYRISGSSLVAAMDHTYEAPCADKLYGQPGDLPNVFLEDKETNDALDLTNETLTGMAGKAGRVHQAVDVAEVIWHWAHALQRIEKKSLHWAKANDGEGPDILRNAQGGLSDHAESLAVTLAEHQQHLASFQVLINQLKEVAPAIQNSISECTDKLNNITSNLPPMNRLHGRPMSPIKAHGRMNSDTDEVAEVTSRISNVQFDRRRQGTVLQTIRTENLPDRKSLDTSSSTQSVRLPEGSDSSDVQNLKREVRETALSLRPSNSVSSLDSHSDGSSEHFFAPLSESRFSHLDAKERIASLRSRRLFVSQLDSPLESHASDGHGKNQLDENLDMLNDLEKLSDYDHVNGCLSYTGSNATSETQWSVYDFEDAQDEVFSPPLLMDSSLLADSFEDLLAPLSDSEMALMEQ